MNEYEFIDVETNTSYNIILTPEKFLRAQNDLTYATKILENEKRKVIAMHSNLQQYVETEKNVEISEQEINKENILQKLNEIQSDPLEECQIWSKSATLLFIELYKQYEQSISIGKCTSAAVFKKMHDRMKEKHYNYSVKQCSSKLTSLKRTYKKIRDLNKKSGNSRVDWPYFKILDEVFSKKPWIEPISTASSSTSASASNDESDSITNSESTSTNQRKRTTSTVLEKHLDRLTQIKKRERAEKIEQYEAKMKRLGTMNELLAQLVSKVTKDNN